MMDWRHSDAYGCLSDDIESEQRSRRFVEVMRNPSDVTEERDGFIFSCFVLSDEGELWNLCRRLTVRGITKDSNRWNPNGLSLFYIVRVGGVEPPRAYTHCHLKTARLPFRHTRRQSTNLHPDAQSYNLRRVAVGGWRHDAAAVGARRLRRHSPGLRSPLP